MKLLFCILIALFTFGCNVFELKDPEPPDGMESVDPFSFNSLLRRATQTRESFRSPDYEDVFADNFEYETTVSGKISRSKLIETLQLFHGKISGVEWKVDGFFNDGKNLHVFGVVYKVYYEGRIQFSGKADFRMVKELDWKITYWKDTPDDESRPFLNLR